MAKAQDITMSFSTVDLRIELVARRQRFAQYQLDMFRAVEGREDEVEEELLRALKDYVARTGGALDEASFRIDVEPVWDMHTERVWQSGWFGFFRRKVLVTHVDYYENWTAKAYGIQTIGDEGIRRNLRHSTGWSTGQRDLRMAYQTPLAFLRFLQASPVV